MISRSPAMPLPLWVSNWWNAFIAWVKGLTSHEAFFAAIVAAAALVAVWQTNEKSNSERLNELRMYLVELNYISREASRPDASEICSPAAGCMGSLTIKQTYIEHLEFLALNAFELAKTLDVLETENMVIADALYKCGKLDESTRLALQLTKSDDCKIQFRAYLLLAQIAFFKGEPEKGERNLQDALAIVSDTEHEIPKVEQGIMKAQAHLICGRMHVAMGKPEESVHCQKNVFDALKDLPETNRVSQLIDALQSLVAASKEKNRFRGQSFDEFVKQLEPEPTDDPAMEQEIPPAPERAPSHLAPERPVTSEDFNAAPSASEGQ